MKECPTCHCQVVSEVKVCPYCGTAMEYTRDRTETVYTAQKPAEPIRKLDVNGAYETPVGQPMGFPPQYRNTNPCYPQGCMGNNMWQSACEERSYVPVHEKNNGLIYVLVALLGCMIAANVLELVAILLLLK